MESMYPAIKHSHMLFVALTIILFNLRFWLRTTQPEKPLHVVLRVFPHFNDSLLLFSGMLMMQIARWQLFGPYNWLGTKLILVVAYIVVGALCMRAQPNSKKWWALYAVAMLIIATIVYLARYKPI
ncbi:SirB2 family protein [Neisseriaceae bacterium B1]